MTMDFDVLYSSSLLTNLINYTHKMKDSLNYAIIGFFMFVSALTFEIKIHICTEIISFRVYLHNMEILTISSCFIERFSQI